MAHPAMMKNDFQFVDFTHVDRTTRRLMRSHVMKGKNVGKKILRPSRLDLAKKHPYNYKSLKSNPAISKEQDGSPDSDYSSPSKIAGSFGSAIAFEFPIELTEHSLKVINQFFFYVAEKMYTSYLGLSQAEAISPWLHFLLSDEIAAHCSIALMEALNDSFFHRFTSSPKSLYHYSQALNLVNKRLETDEALSDSTLGIVLSIILQEQIRREWGEAEIHYNGLKKMVELRGGLGQLESNPLLLLKICKMDITYSLQHGGSILFYRDRISDVKNNLPLSRLDLDHDLTASSRHNGINPHLQEILVDIIIITNLLNSNLDGFKMTVLTFQETLVSICSRLNRFNALQSPMPTSNKEAGYHIGLTVFMMTLFLRCDSRRILDCDQVSLRLREVLDSRLDEDDRDLFLWLMFIGGIWILVDGDKSWLFSRIQNVLHHSGIKSWADAHRSISKLPWVYKVHDALGRELWDLVHQDYQIESNKP